MRVEAHARYRLAATLASLFVALAAVGSPARAESIQGSVYSNITAFSTCNGMASNTISTQLRDLARDGFAALGYATTAFGGKTFTESTVLTRAALDLGIYAHSHGDYYGSGDIQGFREDSGDCTQSVVQATEIKKARTTPEGRLVAAKLVIMSTCYLAGAPRNGYPSMSEAFGIERIKSDPSGAGYRGPEFFLGYRGTAYTADQLRFESAFWGYVEDAWSLGDAFRLATAGNALRWGTTPDWFGSFTFSGRAQATSPCSSCV